MSVCPEFFQRRTMTWKFIRQINPLPMCLWSWYLSQQSKSEGDRHLSPSHDLKSTPCTYSSNSAVARGPLLPAVKETSGIFQAKLIEGCTTSRSPIKLWALLPSLVHGQAPPHSTLGLLTILYSLKLLLRAVCWWSHIKGPRLRILSASVSLLAPS